MNPWLLAARPKTLLASVAPVTIGLALAHREQPIHWLCAWACLFGAIAIQIGTNFCNDYFDFVQGADTAARIGPARAVASGWITPGAMLCATSLMFAIALGIGGYLAWRAGWVFFAIAVVSVACGVWYTAGPYSLAYLGLGEPFVLAFFGPLAVGGTYYVQTRQVTWPVILAGMAPGLLSVGLLAINNLRDIEQDRAAAKRTLAVRFGKRFARWEYSLSIIVALLVPILLWRWFGFGPSILIATLTGLISMAALRMVWRGEGTLLNRALGMTALQLLVYSLLFSVGVQWS